MNVVPHSSIFPLQRPQGLTPKAAAKLKQLQQSTKQKIKKFWVKCKFQF
jgi:hypothetical protein